MNKRRRGCVRWAVVDWNDGRFGWWWIDDWIRRTKPSGSDFLHHAFGVTGDAQVGPEVSENAGTGPFKVVFCRMSFVPGRGAARTSLCATEMVIFGEDSCSNGDVCAGVEEVGLGPPVRGCPRDRKCHQADGRSPSPLQNVHHRGIGFGDRGQSVVGVESVEIAHEKGVVIAHSVDERGDELVIEVKAAGEDNC